MFKQWFNNLFNLGNDSWSQHKPQSSAPQPVNAPQPQAGATPQPTQKPQPSLEALRNQLLHLESTEQEASAELRQLRIVDAASGSVVGGQRRVFNADGGLVESQQEVLLITAEGKLVHSGQLQNGVLCSACGKTTSVLGFCHYCRRPVCPVHAIPWKQGVACPACHRVLVQQNDTWNEE